ncbi:hypothetical protein RUM44_013080 [Polyplax serrata]|uniref:Crossover junction endonuclease MUS81 n=1 Tax=Polyplax serrata TaxID=468196 RepID=A0ABR1BD48_POLSC
MTTPGEPLKRVKRRIRKCQNPLFEKWLKEWREEAAKNGSEMQYCFNKALKSLQKFPFKLENGKQCLVLENFGSKICQMLDDKLKEGCHNELNTHKSDIDAELVINTDNHKRINAGIKRKSSEISSENKRLAEVACVTENAAKINHTKSKDYLPAQGTGAHAILITMLEKSQESGYKGYLLKSEIQCAAQKYCNTSFTVPKASSFYTAWSSMNILIKKQLVNKTGNPPKYCLSEIGTDLATQLKCMMQEENVPRVTQSSLVNKNVNSVIKLNENQTVLKENLQHSDIKLNNQKSPSRNKALTSTIASQEIFQEEKMKCDSDEEETIIMLPNSFKILLLVDNQERDNKFQHSDQMTMRLLKSRNVNFKIRHLSVGDFIWIARNDQGQELVLPYVVERKRMDDLASSIKDGRFHEQKFRLKQSGLQNLIYLVEKYGNESQRLGLPLPTLAQAISNTQVVGRFTVKITENHNHSMRYLDCMTKQLNNIFKHKTLMSCQKSDLPELKLSDDFVSLMTFKDFNKGSEKNKKLTVRNMLVKHLLQLNGLSVEKAKAIVNVFPTPKLLMHELGGSNGEKTISKLTYGGFNRSIGPVAAKQIHMLYTSTTLQ